MKKILSALIITVAGMATAFAQGPYPLVTIQQIQERTQSQLDSGLDLSNYNGDTVRVRGIVVTPPGQAVSTSTWGRWIWIQDGSGPWSGLNVRVTTNPFTSIGDNLQDVLVGDSIEVVGVLNAFPDNLPGNETQLSPISGYSEAGVGGAVRFLPGGRQPVFSQISVGTLNDTLRNWVPSTGEQWEGSPVFITNVTVVALGTLSSPRCSFTVEDVNGNRVEIWDTFWVQRQNASSAVTLTSSGSTDTLPQLIYPNFVCPNIGDFYDTIRGVVQQNKNAGVVSYWITPWDTSHYKKGVSLAPQLTNLRKNKVFVSSTDSMKISVNVNFTQGTPIVRLFYKIGFDTLAANDSITMILESQGVYSAFIPPQANNTWVKYYAKAIGGVNSATIPANAPVGYQAYPVRDAGLNIFDLQFTPFSDGNSLLRGDTVTVSGVVTASASDLGRVFIQQPGLNEWAGIELAGGNIGLATLQLGQVATVTGVVQENFGFTRLNGISSVSTSGTGTITALNLEPQIFSSPPSFLNAEKYEGMLIRLVNNDPSPSDSLYIIQTNADAAPSNFREYRIGKSVSQPTAGCRIKAGITSPTSEPASGNVSFIAPYTPGGTILSLSPGVDSIYVVVGERMKSVTGIMLYTFSNFKLYPRTNADFEDFTMSLLLGINEGASANSSVKIYPNPANDQISIAIDGLASSRYHYSIHSIVGNTIENGSLANGVNEINVAALLPGNYFVVITAEDGSIIKRSKVIINK